MSKHCLPSTPPVFRWGHWGWSHSDKSKVCLVLVSALGHCAHGSWLMECSVRGSLLAVGSSAAWSQWAPVTDLSNVGSYLYVNVYLGVGGRQWTYVRYVGNRILKQVLGTKQYCCSWSKQGLKTTFLNSLNNGVLLEKQLQTAYSSENSERDRWLPSEDVELYINGTRPFKL